MTTQLIIPPSPGRFELQTILYQKWGESFISTFIDSDDNANSYFGLFLRSRSKLLIDGVQGTCRNIKGYVLKK